MRIFCTYILLIALTLQSFYRSIMTIDYQVHLADYLSKCINKDRPWLHCKGQCELMKKIREKEKEDTKKNFEVQKYNALYVHNECTVMAKYPQNEKILNKPSLAYLIDYSFKYHTPIFHPPLG